MGTSTTPDLGPGKKACRFQSRSSERPPAIAHVDGTRRMQMVDRATNCVYHNLVRAAKRRTGVGIVLNTSFNENEPVVATPGRAVSCFMRTGMDALCLGRLELRKPPGARPVSRDTQIS